jgi:YidC/Oxa1 family membrane protein insertase
MQENNKNIMLATMISMVILLAWTWFYEKPRLEKQEAQKKEILAKNINKAPKNLEKAANNAKNLKKIPNSQNAVVALKNRQDIIKDEKNLRVKIQSDQLHGSIYLKGARFDDLTLANYFEKIDKKQEVVLFSPSQSKERYFADFGWLSSDAKLDLPTPETVWKANSKILSPKNPINLSWKNRQNVTFLVEISMDENFMFFIKQSVKNNSGKNITIANYGRINRSINALEKGNYIIHEGFLGVFNGILQEYTYQDSIEDGNKSFNSTGSTWLGITDKYWLSSIVADENFDYRSDFSHKTQNQSNVFNSEFVSQEFKLENSQQLSFEHKLFAGAKKVKIIDNYAKKFNIKLFDRAIDFGWFYFLTKPMFFALSFLNKFLGNFGLAILLMTVLIKAALFPMANKSYRAIAKMKKLQPKITEIREKFKDDRIAMNREMMALYKREKINPASGCLPILLQIPIFFSLYKVIFVTLDMRHAPFYGWIKDLSAVDPTSIFNLFGLLPFEVGGIFLIGVWPILMGITMHLQQRLSPPPADPTQATVMKFLPLIFTFILASFPAGLVIYWTWNNLLSILQQLYITKIVNKEK